MKKQHHLPTFKKTLPMKTHLIYRRQV